MALMVRLYEQYEMSQANQSDYLFYHQLAELVCKGSLEDIIAASTEVTEADLSKVKDLFDAKNLKNLNIKARKGLWDKLKFRWMVGKSCKSYFAEKYIWACLQKANVPVSNENIVTARIVLFGTMCQGIQERNQSACVLTCVEQFAQAYPELTKKIAREYPTYFVDQTIAGCCLKEDSMLLAKVIEQLSNRLFMP